MKSLIALAALALVSTTSLSSPAQAAPKQTAAVSDAALVHTLPGFTNGEATVNGVRLH